MIISDRDHTTMITEFDLGSLRHAHARNAADCYAISGIDPTAMRTRIVIPGDERCLKRRIHPPMPRSSHTRELAIELGTMKRVPLASNVPVKSLALTNSDTGSITAESGSHCSACHRHREMLRTASRNMLETLMGGMMTDRKSSQHHGNFCCHQQLTQADRPCVAAILSAIAVCSDIGASCGKPVPPIAAQVDGRI